MIRNFLLLVASLFVAVALACASPQTQHLDMQGYRIQRLGQGTISTEAARMDQIPGRNVIIGGNFDTNPWQRGTSLAGITSGGLTYLADRFFITNGTDGIATYSRATDAPTVTQAGIFTTNSLKVAITTGDAAIGAAQYFTIGQKIEGYNWAQLAQKNTMLSFWVKAHRAGTYCIAARNGAGDRSLVIDYTINAADTWEQKQISLTASPSGGTWSYTTGTGLTLEWTLAAGSNYRGTASSWQSSNLLSSSNQINGVAANTDTFQLALVQLEAGSVATPFELRPVGLEYQLAARYFYRGGIGWFGKWDSATTCRLMGGLPVIMRVAPTTTVNSTAPVVEEVGVANRTGASSATSSTALGVSGGRVLVNGFTLATAGNWAFLTTDSLDFSAEY